MCQINGTGSVTLHDVAVFILVPRTTWLAEVPGFEFQIRAEHLGPLWHTAAS